MKQRIKVIFSIGLLCVGVLLNFTFALAYEGVGIPEEMEPGTIIENTTDHDFKVVKGGFLSESDKEIIKENNFMVQEELEQTLLEMFPGEEIHNDFNQHREITPVKGMKVTYADDGLVLGIEYPAEVENPLLKENNATTYGAILPSEVTLVRSWGSIPNKLYVDRKSNTIFGTGRATTFSDMVGQVNHRLTQGDIATKLDSDNCKLGIGVTLTANKKTGGSLERTMYKWDAGGMPNAIVDIWQTGVAYWGYTYTSSLSINGVSIEHANINQSGQRLY